MHYLNATPATKQTEDEFLEYMRHMQGARRDFKAATRK